MNGAAAAACLIKLPPGMAFLRSVLSAPRVFVWPAGRHSSDKDMATVVHRMLLDTCLSSWCIGPRVARCVHVRQVPRI